MLNGTRDVVTPPAWGEALAEHTGGRLITLEGSGHVPQGRIPTKVNLMLREFITGRPWRDRTVHRPNGRPRALYVSSPIGLGTPGGTWRSRRSCARSSRAWRWSG